MQDIAVVGKTLETAKSPSDSHRTGLSSPHRSFEVVATSSHLPVTLEFQRLRTGVFEDDLATSVPIRSDLTITLAISTKSGLATTLIKTSFSRRHFHDFIISRRLRAVNREDEYSEDRALQRRFRCCV